MTDANATERRAGSAADWEDAVAVGPPWSALVDLRVLPPRGPNRADSPTPHPSQRRQSGCARTHFSFLSFSFYPRPLNGRSTVVTDSPVSQSEKERKNSLPTAAAPSASSRCLSLDLSHSLRRENVLSLASSQARSAATSTPRRSRLCCAYTCHHAPISSLPLVAMSHISVVFLLFSFVFFIYIYIYIYIYFSFLSRLPCSFHIFSSVFFLLALSRLFTARSFNAHTYPSERCPQYSTCLHLTICTLAIVIGCWLFCSRHRPRHQHRVWCGWKWDFVKDSSLLKFIVFFFESLF